MSTLGEILDKHQITLRNFNHGNHRTTCPRCSATRRKRRDPCLSISIDQAGVRWNCWHCGFSGGEFYDAGPGGSRLGQGAGHQPGDFGAARRRERYCVFPRT
jgi:hypothetical protein